MILVDTDNKVQPIQKPKQKRKSNLKTMQYNQAEQYVLHRLEYELPKNLYYHGIHHTQDVVEAACRIAKAENVEGEDLILVKTAALYHDTGLVRNKFAGHEKVSCEIATETLPRFGYTNQQIEAICTIIKGTKVPQSPENFLAEILCDADLDYLGREDFYRISRTLYKEFREYEIVKNRMAWNRMQVDFLKKHRYFTNYSKKNRAKRKRLYRKSIENTVLRRTTGFHLK